MSAIIGEGVSLRGIVDDEYGYTWNLTGAVAAGDVGKAMTQDTAVANSAKLTTDGAVVLGALASYENRVQEGIVVGAIYRKGVFVWEYTGAAPALGVGVVGSATGGKVKAAAGAVVNNMVVEVNVAATTVTVVFD